MDLQTNNSIHGLHKGVYYGQNDRIDELNDRINSRYFSDSPLQPNIDSRPVPTKYSHFPIVNRRTQLKEPIVPYMDFNQSVNFNPGSSRAPPSGYLNNVDTEILLRNQTYALQRSDQSIYVPSSKSDLYNIHMPSPSRTEDQPHPNLFVKGEFNSAPHPNVMNSNIGGDDFFNHTRTQLRNM